jgi:hypothetical protein
MAEINEQIINDIKQNIGYFKEQLRHEWNFGIPVEFWQLQEGYRVLSSAVVDKLQFLNIQQELERALGNGPTVYTKNCNAFITQVLMLQQKQVHTLDKLMLSVNQLEMALGVPLQSATKYLTQVSEEARNIIDTDPVDAEYAVNDLREMVGEPRKELLPDIPAPDVVPETEDDEDDEDDEGMSEPDNDDHVE